jgi:hypothetical protein
LHRFSFATPSHRSLISAASTYSCDVFNFLRSGDPVRLTREIWEQEAFLNGDELINNEEPVNVLESLNMKELVTPRQQINGVATLRQVSKQRQTSTPTLANRFGKNIYS